MTDVPEKGRDGRTGASHRPCPDGTAWPASSVLGPSSPDRKYLTTVCENASRLKPDATGLERCVCRLHIGVLLTLWRLNFARYRAELSHILRSLHDLPTGDLEQPDRELAKARERSEQERGGGWGESEANELEGGSEGKGRSSEAMREIRVRCGRGAEASPSGGWREVAATMHAAGGQGHE